MPLDVGAVLVVGALLEEFAITSCSDEELSLDTSDEVSIEVVSLEVFSTSL